jgi:hypothetical protein
MKVKGFWFSIFPEIAPEKVLTKQKALHMEGFLDLN